MDEQNNGAQENLRSSRTSRLPRLSPPLLPRKR